jgi:sulfatase maturation enzyme AslB (radical SAM superfamily)
MERFVHLYPDYSGRAVAITVTSGHDPICSNAWMSKFIEFYSIGVVTYVRSITTNDKTSPCDGESCKHDVNDLLYPNNNLAFYDWTSKDTQRFDNAYTEFIADLYESPLDSYKRWPIFYELFKDRYRELFRRKIFTQRVEKISSGCLPGAVRLFCNVYGDYYPCERVEQSDSLKIGNIWTGIDVAKVKWMIDVFLENVNCHQCIGEYLCSICPTSIMENKGTGKINYKFIKEECQQKINSLKKRLVHYVSICEEKPMLFQQIYSEEKIVSDDDWLPEIQLVLDSNQQTCHCCQLTTP